MGAEPLSATVIVPCASNLAGLSALLSTLAEQSAPHQLIVVDNGSPGSAASALARRAGAEAIRFEQNRGYTVAINAAARAAEGEAIVLVNDDELLEADFVAAIVAALDPTAGIVMAAGVMREAGDPTLIDSAGMELDATLLVFDYLNGQPLGAAASAPSPLGPSGAAAAFERSAYLDVGGFDEAIFAYWEDADLVLRMRGGGARCALAAGAIGTHHHSATLGSGSAEKDYLTGWGRSYMLRKWGVARGRRLPAVVARELAITAGQLVVDRNLGGVRGRIDGFRAPVARRRYPESELDGARASGFAETLARRLRRRARLRSAAR